MSPPEWLKIDRIVACCKQDTNAGTPSALKWKATAVSDDDRSPLEYLVKWCHLDYNGYTSEEERGDQDILDAIQKFSEAFDCKERGAFWANRQGCCYAVLLLWLQELEIVFWAQWIACKLQDYGLGSKSIRQTKSCEPKLWLLPNLELWVLLGALRVVDQFPPTSLPNSSKASLLLCPKQKNSQISFWTITTLSPRTNTYNKTKSNQSGPPKKTASGNFEQQYFKLF
jgi:hypothetical protein